MSAIEQSPPFASGNSLTYLAWDVPRIHPLMSHTCEDLRNGRMVGRGHDRSFVIKSLASLWRPEDHFPKADWWKLVFP